MTLDDITKAIMEAGLAKDPRKAELMKKFNLSVEDLADYLAPREQGPDDAEHATSSNDSETHSEQKAPELPPTPLGRKPKVRMPKKLDDMVADVLRRADSPLNRMDIARAINEDERVVGEVKETSVQNAARHLLADNLIEVASKKRPMKYRWRSEVRPVSG